MIRAIVSATALAALAMGGAALAQQTPLDAPIEAPPNRPNVMYNEYQLTALRFGPWKSHFKTRLVGVTASRRAEWANHPLMP